jgi:hypothetical protein
MQDNDALSYDPDQDIKIELMAIIKKTQERHSILSNTKTKDWFFTLAYEVYSKSPRAPKAHEYLEEYIFEHD